MNYITVTTLDINNGLGCRATLWVSGCGFKCEGCQNEWLQDYSKGKPLYESFDKLAECLQKPYIKGITISGGDPLNQSTESLYELKELLLRISTEYPDKDVWIYSGYRMEELNFLHKEILSMCHYFVDGRFDINLRDINLAFRGSANQRIWMNENGKWVEIENPEFYFKEVIL